MRATGAVRKARTPTRQSSRRTSAGPEPGSDAALKGASGTVRAPDHDQRGPDGRGGWGSSRLYRRDHQRARERWSLGARLSAALLLHPELVLATLGRRSPVRIQGRVLNRSVQALLAASERIASATGTASGLDGQAALDDVERMRSQMRAMTALAMPRRTDVYAADRDIPVPAPGDALPIRVYRRYGNPPGTFAPAIVYFHGGGWATGDLATHDASCRLLAAVTGCVVVAVDYRLAPEHPYPAAVEDALGAYRWVHAHTGELGITAGRVGVAGDSAGGNLAAVVALLTRPGADGSDGVGTGVVRGAPGDGAAPVPPPVMQGLVYPALDAHLDTESVTRLGTGFFLTREAMELFRSAYVPDPATWDLPTVSPLLATDLSGLAPAVVVTAGFDPLRDEGNAYAEAMRAAGVDVVSRCYDDQVHGFFGMGVLPDGMAVATEVCDAIGRAMWAGAPV